MSNNSTYASSSRSKGGTVTKKIKGLLIPLILVVTILPLIVHEYKFTPDISKQSWFIPNVVASDYFLFYKSILLTGIGFLLLAILLYKQFATKDKPSNRLQAWCIPLGTYAGFVLLSGVVSSHSSVSWNGSYEQFETVLVLLAYCILAFYAYCVIESQEDVQMLLKWAYIGISIMILIGLLQLIGADPFATSVGKWLISSDKSKEAIDAMSFSFEKNRVYMTLFNPNYVGVFSSIFFPITMGLAITSTEWKKKIVNIVLSILLVVVVFGAQSKTGLLTLAGTGILVLLILHKKIIRSKKSMFAIMGAFLLVIVAFFVVNGMQNNTYLNRIKNAFTAKDATHALESIDTTEDYILIKYKGVPLYVRCFIDADGNIDFSVCDKENNKYELTYDNTSMQFSLVDPTFETLKFTPAYLGDETTFGCQIVIDNKEWNFKSKTDTEGYQYLNAYNNLEQIKTAPASLFTNHESIFTGRGYIWSRSIPLLKNYLLLGAGPNAYVYEFPQNDYVGKYNNSFDNQLVTKPHNMYLQMFIETGLPACIAFVVLCIMYIVYAWNTFKKTGLETLTDQVGALISISVIGYMVSGLIVDYNVGVAPFFWIVLGLGFACVNINRRAVARKEKLEKMNLTNK
ncbi:O-antigen ligase family protein [Anaerosporobacter faecicola]|uniref:O-antigen ligase family protein n=1 Tax=Anaerosporobacter faecicola TaxID=2718714 RepID=UPI001439026D|nr:O-antigen ligase family protein [Anaerosporobacter faecicola]